MIYHSRAIARYILLKRLVLFRWCFEIPKYMFSNFMRLIVGRSKPRLSPLLGAVELHFAVPQVSRRDLLVGGKTDQERCVFVQSSGSHVSVLRVSCVCSACVVVFFYVRGAVSLTQYVFVRRWWVLCWWKDFSTHFVSCGQVSYFAFCGQVSHFGWYSSPVVWNR